jgi:RHS repeat-associated protein
LGDVLCFFGFEPVNLVTGAVVYKGADFELPGPLPLVWKREWSSDSLWQGPLGHGCHWNYDMRIERFPEHNDLVLTLDDGRPVNFMSLMPGESDFHRTEKLTLTHNGDHYELLDHESRLFYTFPIVSGEKEYLLTSVRNEAGHSIQLVYNNGRIYQVIDSAGRRIWVTTDEKKRITKAELEVEGKTRETLIEYAYNDEGDMVGITDALGQTTHIAYQNHLMVKKTDRNGQSFYWEYDGTKPKSRCIHTWGDGGLLEGRIEYHTGYNLVTDSLGNTTRYDFTPDFYVTAITDPLNNKQLFDYTPEGDLLREIDEEGNITGYDYNEMGLLSAIIYPDGGRRSYGYDEQGRRTFESTPEGATTVYTYDEAGLLERQISPDNRVSHYLYNDRNLIDKIITDSQEIELKYDDRHNLIEATLPDGLHSEWQYDHRGQVTRSRNTAGEINSYRYDLLGRVVGATSPDGNDVKLGYNAYDEVMTARDHDRHVEFDYTPLGSLRRRTEDGKTIIFGYNTEEQLKFLRNENNETYRFGRDAAGRIVTESGFDGLTRRYTRSATGNVSRVERPGERFSEFLYDVRGRLNRVDYHDGSFERYAYNMDGLLIEAENNNSLLKITRDKQGRVIEESQDGFTVQSKYDKRGQRTLLTSSLGANLKMGYTEAGLLREMKTEGWDMALKYDHRGLEVERSLTGGVVARNEYDDIGRIHRHRVSTARGSDTRRIKYAWGVNDRLVNITNELTKKDTWFDYDSMGNLVGATYNQIEKLFRVPDAVGNLYKTADRKDRKYGPGGRLLKAEGTRYEYDEEGNLTEKKEAGGKRWQYEWNANGSLKMVTRPDRQQVNFEYDALGRRTAKLFDKRITRWVWDGNTPLHEWSYPLDERPKTVQDEFGLDYKDKPEPVANLITWVFEEGTFKPTARLTDSGNQSIITDYLGTPVQMYDNIGHVTWEAEFDIYGKNRSFVGSSLADCPFRYQGQYEDAETGLYYNRFRYYDADMGGYLSQDPIGLQGGTALYSYVHDTNYWTDIFGLNAKPETAAQFEARISGMSPGERIAAVRGKMDKVAPRNGWEKNDKLSKINNRPVYTDINGNNYSVDTQHGRFEKSNSKGQHLGEFDIDSTQQKPADISGKHNIKCG